jgi:hypothetical protein
MTPQELERVLMELRDTNRQLAASIGQIAQSLSNIERAWMTQIQAFRWTKWALVPVFVLVVLAMLPLMLMAWKVLR